MLFDSFKLGPLSLQNRTVMAPMTRCRAVVNNTPNELVAQYYGQRANAGLIITEGTSPSPDGIGYARIPGLYNAEQVAGWKLATDAAHQGGAKIFIQFMHCGRVTGAANLPAGARAVGPTSENCPGEMYTDAAGMQAHAQPHALTESEITEVVAEYAQAAKLAVEAGFDGIELHGANGYLIEQFLNANVNSRTDGYGGSAAARNRFALEVAKACVDAIGADRVGMRISPYGVFNSTGAFDGVEAQYLDLVKALSDLGLVYVHLVDHSAMGAPEVPAAFKAQLRATFKGAFIASGGFETVEAAEAVLAENRGDLIAFGRPFISNPDLVHRLKNQLPLAQPDANTFYTADAVGYTDYPTAA
ncbi:alkene reductase [Chitinibacter bivalviorum]|uniref:Alkene reductase n=1 Tax=Chitinibacter bivalviorum TaxID=2739434 RepID=A0A7H9BK63_9NEIS|nr:alkene reductase [Chitinibacter bivalviorum]QLG88879.1 alkene reductase [Chitinibacter bivalviorum]